MNLLPASERALSRKPSGKPGSFMGRFFATAADLAFGSVCAGCAKCPGVLCSSCRRVLTFQTVTANVAGVDGLLVAAIGEYTPVLRAVIVAHKEQGRLALAKPLGRALARSVEVVRAECTCSGRINIVPIPSRAVSTRQRGHDPLLRVARHASVALRRSGHQAAVVRILRHARRVRDQAELSRAEREINMHEAFSIRAPRYAPLGCNVIVDDVLTTGATVREAIRATAAHGIRVCGVAVLAVV